MIYIHRYSLWMVYAVAAEPKYDRWGGGGGGGGGGGLALEPVKQPIICVKRLRAKVKIWGG